ncbi:Metallo-dependent hydrolase, partial [Eremomyces bilateralis CBS 781.70]
MADGWFTTFTNCRLCINGKLVEDQFVVSEDTGKILHRTGYIGGEIVDLEEGIIAPGFLELQTNGVNGFHFTHFEDAEQYQQRLDDTAKYYVTEGVTGFWATIPTVSSDDFQKILPSLRPRSIPDGATLLGAHCEGPYLHPSKKGAHNEFLFQQPTTEPQTIYGEANLKNIKLCTLAPELPSSTPLIRTLTANNTRVSLGHSTATFSDGLSALSAGATALTHVFNAMSPLHHRNPGLPGLITAPAINNPYYSLITDGHHLDPSIATLLYRANPAKCILITDSVELAGLPDGVYPGHAQIPQPQEKRGALVTVAGTEIMVGGCLSLQ